MADFLVTGGAGFVGSHIVEALVKRGDRVRVIDNLDTGKRQNLAHLPERVELVIADINDTAALAKAMTGCQVVFHQAALASVPRSIDDPLATHATCATGTLNVLNCARQSGIRRVVYAASSSAYGDQPAPRKIETALPSPLSPYAAAKLAGELYCQAFWHSFGLETVCLRYFNVFGPRQDPSGPYAAVIPLFIQAVLSGNRPTIFGDGRQTRDFTYVENVVHANLLAAVASDAAGMIFNVGSGEPTTLLDLLTELNSLMGTNIEPIFAAARVGDVRDSLAEISLAKQVLGYQPIRDMRTGLRQTVEFYRQAISAR